MECSSSGFYHEKCAVWSSFLPRGAYMHSAVLAVETWLAGRLDVTRRLSKRIKISSNFFIDLVALPLWFSNTALWLWNSNGKSVSRVDLEIFGPKTLYDPAACRYVNTPSAYDTAVQRPTSCRYFSSLRMISRRAGFSASADSFLYYVVSLTYMQCLVVDVQALIRF